jgi:FeS assembly SUF system protein
MFSIFNKLTGRAGSGDAETADATTATATPPPPETSGSSAPALNVDALVAPPATPPAEAAFGPVDQAKTEALSPAIVDAISTVFDPEIPVNIYELGLIYSIEADAESRVHVNMTLTSPACPSAQQLPSEVRYKVKAVEGVKDCAVEVVWEPPWTKDMMSETAKLTLGMF